MYICRNSEGVHAYLLKCCRGTCSSVGMVRERWGAPELGLECSACNHSLPTLYTSIPCWPLWSDHSEGAGWRRWAYVFLTRIIRSLMHNSVDQLAIHCNWYQGHFYLRKERCERFSTL